MAASHGEDDRLPRDMLRRVLVPLLGFSLFACTGEADPTKSAEPAKRAEPSAPAASGETKPDRATKPETKPEANTPNPTPQAETRPRPSADPTTPPIPAAGTLDEIAIKPWSSSAHTRPWTLVAEPAEALTLVDLHAGVLGKAGATWYQLGADGLLAKAEMDVEPRGPVLGVWPSDAWFIEDRFVDGEGGDDMQYQELRLMKLRGGNRWVPQSHGGEQWFHPGTCSSRVPTRISTLSGMLVIGMDCENDRYETVTRVAGKHADPMVGSHRGGLVEFIENGSGQLYVITYAEGYYFAQIHCEDDACVAEFAKRLPLSDWKFSRQVARGRHSVSILATSDTREFLLHHRGKKDGWVLDELPVGETPTGMWASEEGGLWTLAGERLRWRNTESAWHDEALPEGLSGPSVALSEDRKQVVVAGLVGGSPKLFSTYANTEAPVPAATPAPTP